MTSDLGDLSRPRASADTGPRVDVLDAASDPTPSDARATAVTHLLCELAVPEHLVDVLVGGAVSDAQWAVQSAVLADRRVGELPAAWVELELQVLEAVAEQCRHLTTTTWP